MAVKKPINGQTNYDMAMQLYGSLDILVKLSIDSGVSDLSILVPQYTYDENSLIKNSAYTGYNYTTAYNPDINICSKPTGLYSVDISYFEVTFAWDNPSGLNYQYSYNNSGRAPNEDEWIDTTSSILMISGLTDDTDWYIWLRTKCNDGLFSQPIFIVAHTLLSPPAPPVTSNLLLALFSDIGVAATGSDINTWTDSISGYGHVATLLNPANHPLIINSHFGGKQGIRFPLGGANFMLTVPFVLLSGSTAATIYIVMSAQHIGSGAPVFLGLSTTFGSSPGAGGLYITQDTLDRVHHLTTDSTNSSNEGVNAFTVGSDFLTTLTIDTSLTPASAKTTLYHNNDATGYVIGLSAMSTGTLLGSELRIGFTSNQIIGAILIYDGLHNNTDRANTWAYLQTYFTL